MKIIIILCLTILLQANCIKENEEKSNELFYKANQEEVKTKQLALLKSSLEECFSYEVAYSVYNLEGEMSLDIEEKIKLYNQALESLSLIRQNDKMVLAEQNRLNLLIAKLYEPIDKKMSTIYKSKVEAISIPKKDSSSHLKYILFSLFLLFILWSLQPLFKKLGKNNSNLV